IHEVSLYVHRDGRDDREADLADYDAYYRHLSAADPLPTISQPSIGDFLAFYEPLLEARRDIVWIHIASGMSVTVRAAGQARAQLGEHADRVNIVDSASACGGEGLVVLAGHASAARGTGAAEVASHARATRAALKMWFAVDTLEYL